MPKYLIQASYTAEGVKGLLKEGGSSRRKAVEEAIKSMGGKLEAFYYAFGESDAFIIVDAPDNTGVVASSLAVNASGAAHCKTVVLLTPEDVDQAVKRAASFTYRLPGR